MKVKIYIECRRDIADTSYRSQLYYRANWSKL